MILRRIQAIGLVFLVLMMLAACARQTPVKTPTPTTTRTPTPTVTLGVVSPVITATLTPAPPPADTPTRQHPTATPAPAATPTHTSTPTSSPTPTHTPSLPDTIISTADLRQPAGHILWYRDDGLWLVDPETGDRQRAQMEAEAAAWSPRGDYLAVLEPPWPGQEAPADALILTVYDLAAGQRRTYPDVHLASHSGVTWQTMDEGLYLYTIPAGESACLLRLDPRCGELWQVLCAEESESVRFVGDVVALPDGRLAHIVLPESGRESDQVSLRLVDPATGTVRHVPLWRDSKTAPALRVPLSFSPDGRLLAALRGPDADPGDQHTDQQGLYLLDLDTGDVQRAFTLPGLRWMVWSPDGEQLAVTGDTQRFGLNAICIYDRATGRAPFLYHAANSLDFWLLSSSFASGTSVGIPLAWTGDGRLLVGLHRRSGDADVVHPRLGWVQVATEAVSFAVPFDREPSDWPISSVEQVGLAVRYPPGWVAQPWQSHTGKGFALGSTSWVPARYAGVDQPQVPHIYLALYRPPLTGTLKAWLDAHGIAASFGTEAGPNVGFFGMGDAVPTAAGGYPALRFTHEVFGSRVHELLLAVGDRVVGLGHPDIGGEDLGLAFVYVQAGLSPAEATLPAGWASEGDMVTRLVVEEYPIVAQEVDGPYRFEYEPRIPPDVLNRRRAWRVPRRRTWHSISDPLSILVDGEPVTVEADSKHTLLTVYSSGRAVYAMTVPWPWVDEPVKGFWSWRGHWILEAEERVIVDGQSLNRALGYDAIFYWRLVQDRPFFFFHDGDTYGVSYDGQVLPYRYDGVVHYMCCEPATFNAAGNETMVWFHALRDGTWYYVEMGVYE
jgi:hypothetical protein